MSDVLTRFREYGEAQKPSPTPLTERFREYGRGLERPADSLVQRFRAYEQQALEPPVRLRGEAARKAPIEELFPGYKPDYVTPKPSFRGHTDIAFERLARWQRGEEVDPKEKDVLEKQAKTVGRFIISSPLIVPQFFHALITDPLATVPGVATMLNEGAKNFFRMIAQPFIGEEQREKLYYYLANDPVGMAFTVAIMGGITAKAIPKAMKVEGIRTRMTRAEVIERGLGEEIKEPLAEIPEVKVEPTKWTTRTKDLQRIHAKQKKISAKDPDFREMKKRIAGKESLKDFTQEETMRFESELDAAIAEGAKPKQIDLFKTVEELTKEPGEDLINKAPSETVRTIEEVTDTMAPVGIFEARPSILEVIKGLPSKIIPDFIKQTRKRVKSEPSQQMLARLRKGDEIRHRSAGDMMESFNKLGLRVIGKRGWGERLSQALLRGEAKSFRELFDKMYDIARAVGVRVAKYSVNYFPRMVKHEIARILQGDIATLERKAFKLSEDIGPLLREAIQNRHIKPETIEALKHLVESGQAETYVDAIAKLKNFTHSEMFSPFGNLEKARVLKLPLDFYEMDAAKVIPRYVRGWAKRVAEVDQFGPKSEVYHDLRNKIDAISPAERRIVDHAVAAWTGAIVRDPKYSMTRRWRGVVDVIVQSEVITKIGLGLATIPNITQSFISTIPHFGVFRTSRGFYRVLRRGQVRAMVRRGGAPMDISARQWAGFETTGKMGKVAERVLSIAFTPVNKFNAYLSASTVEASLPGYYRLANMVAKTKIGKARVAHAKRVLEFLDVDPTKPLTENVTLEAMYRAATDLQVMRNVLRDPLSVFNPRLKALWLFKRFGLKQAQLINDIVLKEIKHGNVWPLLRLAVGGYLGGEFVLWARNKIKSKISGKEYYTEDKKGWERIAMVYASVGAFGVVSDVIDSGIFGDYPKAGTIEFTLLPVQVQTLDKIADTVFRFATEASGDYGLLGATERLKGTAPRLMGPLGTQLAKRLQTDAQRAARLRFERGRAKSKILDLFLDGKGDQAVRVWKAWNKHNKYNIAFGQYDEYGRFLGRLGNIGVLLQNREMERAKKKARP